MIEKPSLWYVAALIGIAVVFFAPRLFPTASPSYDFIYGWEEIESPLRERQPISEETIHRLDGGRLITISTASTTLREGNGVLRVYLHHVSANRSVVLSLDEIDNYSLVPVTVAPDGFVFVKAEPGLFTKNTFAQYALVNGMNRFNLSLNIPSDGSVEPQFLGWVQR